MAVLNALCPGWELRPESDLPQIPKGGKRLSNADNKARSRRFRNTSVGGGKFVAWRTFDEALKLAEKEGKAEAADGERRLKQQKLSYSFEPDAVPVD